MRPLSTAQIRKAERVKEMADVLYSDLGGDRHEKMTAATALVAMVIARDFTEGERTAVFAAHFFALFRAPFDELRGRE